MNLVKRYLHGKKVNPKDLKHLCVYMYIVQSRVYKLLKRGAIYTPIMEKKMENEMETAIDIVLYKRYNMYIGQSRASMEGIGI